MAHLWSGRFDEAPDTALLDFGASFKFDRRLLEDDVKGSLAWSEALAAAGVLSDAEAVAIRDGLNEILERARHDRAFLDSELARGDEDVHSFVERELVSRVGEAGRRLHTGRSRNEQVALDLRLYLKRQVPLLQQTIASLVATLADRAQSSGSTVMPSYTHLRRAQPILVAHFFLSHAAALRRDHARLGWVLHEVDEMPLGSGAVAGASYAIDVKTLATRLGFSRIVANSIDATGGRDFVASFLYTCAMAMVHISRLAEDLILFTSEEFGFFDLADATATGSSLMPQKKNPDPLELSRGKAGRTIGRLAGWLATMKGLPIGYSKDLQEDKEAVFDAEDTLVGSATAVTAVLRGLTANPRATQAAASGLLLATDVADYLVRKGMPFRDAHETVGGVVRQLVRDGRSFESLSLGEWRAHSPLFDSDVSESISAAASVAKKTTPQSTRPESVAAALEELRRWLGGLSLQTSRSESETKRQS